MVQEIILEDLSSSRSFWRLTSFCCHP